MKIKSAKIEYVMTIKVNSVNLLINCSRKKCVEHMLWAEPKVILSCKMADNFVNLTNYLANPEICNNSEIFWDMVSQFTKCPIIG